MHFLFAIACILITATTLRAESSIQFMPEISTSYETVYLKLPVELRYDGKPLDAKCVHEAMNSKSGADLKKGCVFSGDGFGTETITPVGTGYEFSYADGRTGYFYYSPMVKTSAGIILSVYYSMGGAGQFSDLGVYAREGNTLRYVSSIAGGDRCMGGIRSVEMKDGKLAYAFNVTPLQLYQRYVPDAGYRGDMGSGYINCGAVINVIDGQVEQVELAEDALMPSCFAKEYRQAAVKKTLSNDEAKALMIGLSQSCK